MRPDAALVVASASLVLTLKAVLTPEDREPTQEVEVVDDSCSSDSRACAHPADVQPSTVRENAMFISPYFYMSVWVSTLIQMLLQREVTLVDNNVMRGHRCVVHQA